MGKPLEYRLISGLLKPKFLILGCDVAGHVEAVGKNVKQFQPGDDVFGDLCECGWEVLPNMYVLINTDVFQTNVLRPLKTLFA